jgi:hypothetical protein
LEYPREMLDHSSSCGPNSISWNLSAKKCQCRFGANSSVGKGRESHGRKKNHQSRPLRRWFFDDHPHSWICRRCESLPGCKLWNKVLDNILKRYSTHAI